MNELKYMFKALKCVAILFAIVFNCIQIYFLHFYPLLMQIRWRKILLKKKFGYFFTCFVTL